MYITKEKETHTHVCKTKQDFYIKFKLDLEKQTKCTSLNRAEE